LSPCYLCAGPAEIGPLDENGQIMLDHRVECSTCRTYSISLEARRRLDAQPAARGILSAWSRRSFVSSTTFLHIRSATVDDAEAEAQAKAVTADTPEE
jgi:hypothetical protein